MNGEPQHVGFLAGVRRVIHPGGVVNRDLVVVTCVAELKTRSTALDDRIDDCVRFAHGIFWNNQAVLLPIKICP